MSPNNWIVKRSLRIIAIFTLQVFVLTNVFFTAPDLLFAQDLPSAVPSGFSNIILKLPADLGKLDNLYEPFSANRTVFFLHIKDAHTSSEAQRKIVQILKKFHASKRLDLILIEGAAGSLTPERLDVFKDPKMNGAYRNDLFQTGLLNGSGYFIASSHDIPAYGLEDPKKYYENLQIFKQIVNARPGAQKFFNTVEVLMMDIFKNILRLDVYAFLKEWKTQHCGEISWSRYLPFLIASAKKFLDLDLQDYRLQAQWPNLVRFCYLNLFANKIHPKTVSKEFRQLSSLLRGDHDPVLRETLELLSAVIGNPAGMVGEVPDIRYHAEILVNACRRNGIFLQQQQELIRYLAVRIFRSEIDPKKLFLEVDRLEDEIFDMLFPQEKIKKIIISYKEFFILKRAFSVELNRVESERFLNMDIKEKVRKFSKIASQYDLQENEVIRGAELAKEFYRKAQERDRIFTERIKNILLKVPVPMNRPLFVALVTGGYHAQGIEDWLRDAKFPFASFSPTFKDEADSALYEQRLNGSYDLPKDTLTTVQSPVMSDNSTEQMIGPEMFKLVRQLEERLHGRYEARDFFRAKETKSSSKKKKFAKIPFLTVTATPGIVLDAVAKVSKKTASKKTILSCSKTGSVTGPAGIVVGFGAVPAEVASTISEVTSKVVRKPALEEGSDLPFSMQRIVAERQNELASLLEKLRKAVTDPDVKSGTRSRIREFLSLNSGQRSGEAAYLVQLVSIDRTDAKKRRGEVNAPKIPSEKRSGMRQEARANETAGMNRRLVDLRVRAFSGLRLYNHEEDIADKIIQALKSSSEPFEIRMAAANALEGSPFDEAAEALADTILGDDDPRLRNSALGVLSELTTPAGLAQLTRVQERLRSDPARQQEFANVAQMLPELSRRVRNRKMLRVIVACVVIGLTALIVAKQYPNLRKIISPVSRNFIRKNIFTDPETEYRPGTNPAVRNEARSMPERKITRRNFGGLFVFGMAGFLSGCGTFRHDDLKATINQAELFELPHSRGSVSPRIKVDSKELLQKILANDPKVKKAEFEVGIKEIEKDRLKGSWTITTSAAWADGKPVFSGGISRAVPYMVSGGLTGYGVGSLATLATDLAGSLTSILRGERMLAKALAEKVIEAAQLNHQRIISERYAYYAGLAIEIKKLQMLYAISQKALQTLGPALEVAQGRNTVSELERIKIRNSITEWRLKADEYHSLLKAKETQLLNLFVPGTTGQTRFEIELKDNNLPLNWTANLKLIDWLRYDATHKEGKQSPPNRELAAAYKAREAAVIVRELERASGRFSLGFGGFSFTDNLGSPSSLSSSDKTDIASAWDRAMDRRTKDQTVAGVKAQFSFGKGVDAEERISSKKVEITDAVLADVQHTVEDEISELVYRLGKNQGVIKILTCELTQLETTIEHARQKKVNSRRLVTEDRLAEDISQLWKHRIGLIEAQAGNDKAIMGLEVIDGVLGKFSWRISSSARQEVRFINEIRKIGRIFSPARRFFLMISMLFFFATSVFAANDGWNSENLFYPDNARQELGWGNSGTELGDAYERYDGFADRILTVIPEGKEKDGIKNFASILRVTIVSEETLMQAQRLFIREVMARKVPVVVGEAVISGASAIGVNLTGVAVREHALEELDKELGISVPGFKKYARDPHVNSSDINHYRMTIVNAVMTARPVYPKKRANHPKRMEPLPSFKRLLFNWDNPFHSARQHLDVLERAVAEGRVRTNLVFQNRIKDLAQRAGILHTTSEKGNTASEASSLEADPLSSHQLLIPNTTTPTSDRFSGEEAAEIISSEVLSPSEYDVEPQPLNSTSANDSEEISPVMQILLSEPSGTPTDVSPQNETDSVPDVSDLPVSDYQPSSSVSSTVAVNTSSTDEGYPKADGNTAQLAGSGITGDLVTPSGTELTVPSITITSTNSPAALGMSGVFTGKASNNPLSVVFTAPMPGDLELNEDLYVESVVPKDSILYRIVDPNIRAMIRALETEISLIDAQLQEPFLNAEEYLKYSIQREALVQQLRRMNQIETLSVVKTSHPTRITKILKGHVNPGETVVEGIQLDGGQITLRLPIGISNVNGGRLQVDGEPVQVIGMEAGQFDPSLDEQFLLTITYLAFSEKLHGTEADYCFQPYPLHHQPADDIPLGKGKPHHVLTPNRGSVAVSAPDAPEIPVGIFHSLVPEGAFVRAGEIYAEIDASIYYQNQVQGEETLHSLIGQTISANQDVGAIDPQELEKLENGSARRLANLKNGTQPKLVFHAPVDGFVQGLLPHEGNPMVPGQKTSIHFTDPEVLIGSSDIRDPDRVIDVAAGNVRKGSRCLLRTPQGDVLEGVVDEVSPLANEYGVIISDREAVVVRVQDPTGRLSQGNMPVEIWTDVPDQEGTTPAPTVILPLLQYSGHSDISAAAGYELLRHPDRKLSNGIWRTLSGEGSLLQIRTSWDFFSTSFKGLAAVGKTVFRAALRFLAALLFLALFKRIINRLRQERKWVHFQRVLEELQAKTLFLQLKMKQNHTDRDAHLFEDVLEPINEWIRILASHEPLSHEDFSTILTKAQELVTNRYLIFNLEKFRDLDETWATRFSDDLAAIFAILTPLCILTAKRISSQYREQQINAAGTASLDLHELERFKQRVVDYGSTFNESYNLTHHLIGFSLSKKHYPGTMKKGLLPLSLSDRLRIFHHSLVRFLYAPIRLVLWISPVVQAHRFLTLFTFKSINRYLNRLSIKTPEDSANDIQEAGRALKNVLTEEISIDQIAGPKNAAKYARFWRRFFFLLSISLLFFPNIVLARLGLHWLTGTLYMNFFKIIIYIVTIALHIGPIVIKFYGPHYYAWKRELAKLERESMQRNKELPALPTPVAPVPSVMGRLFRNESDQFAMQQVLAALHNAAEDPELEVIALVPPQEGENKAALEHLIQGDAVLRQWPITVVESDGEFSGDASLFYTARNIAKASRKRFKIYWYPKPGIDLQTVLAVFKINLGEAARMLSDLKTTGTQYGEVVFPGGDLVSSSVRITKNGGHFVLQTRHANLHEIEDEQLPAVLGRNGTSRLEIEHILYQPQNLKQIMTAGPLHLGSGRVDLSNMTLPQIPVPSGPVAIVAGTAEENQIIQELLDKMEDKIRNLVSRFGPFRINFLEDVIRPIVELSRQVSESKITPPNPNSLVNRNVRLSNDTVISPYDKLYTVVSQFLWNGGNGNRRSLKGEAFIPPASETFYVPGENQKLFTQALAQLAHDFPELVDQRIYQKIGRTTPVEAKSKVAFLNNEDRKVLEDEQKGYERGWRSVGAAGFVIKGHKLILPRRRHQISNKPGLLDVSFAGNQNEIDHDAMSVARREFQRRLLAGRGQVPGGLIFDEIAFGIDLESTHENEKGSSVRKKRTTVFRVFLNDELSRETLCPGDDVAEFVSMSRQELETELKKSPGRFTTQAYQLLTQIGLDRIFSVTADDFAKPVERHENRLLNAAPGSLSVALTSHDIAGRMFGADKIEPEERLVIATSDEIRILTAIIIAKKILAVQDVGLFQRLEASLERLDMVTSRVAPSLAVLSGLQDLPSAVLKRRLNAFLGQEQSAQLQDDRLVFLDASIVPTEYFIKFSELPVRVVVLFERQYRALYERLTREMSRQSKNKRVILVYAPDGVSGFVKQALQSSDSLPSASFLLNEILANFKKRGKAEDVVLFTGSRAECQKVESYYVGHRYYFGEGTLRLDPELIYYSLNLLLRSPEIFRYGKGRNPQDAVTLIGFVFQRLVEEYRQEIRTSAAA